MPLYTVSALTIDGVAMPAPKVGGMKIKPEKIWSANTKRTADTTMVGTILSIKTTVDLAWPPLTVDQVKTIESVVSNAEKPFVPMSFTDQTGQVHEMEVYFGTPAYSAFDWINGQWMVTDATVSGIER